MIYLYAIIDRPGCGLPSLAGLENASLSEIACQDIAGVYSTLRPEKASTALVANEENIWQHEAVLETLMLAHTVLPLRFGSAFASVAVVSALLQEHYANFSANLLRVQGCVELSLRMNWQNETNQLPVGHDGPKSGSLADPTSAHAPAMSGKDYMQGLLKARQQEADLHQQIETQVSALLHDLDQLAREHTHVVSLTPYPSLKAAYLIAQSDVPLFREEVGHLTALHSDLHFALTGPWPAYNFVTK